MSPTFSSEANPGPAAFPPTRHSLLECLVGEDPAARARAIDVLVRLYWRPAYVHLRLRWRLAREDAEDLTQECFMQVLERESLAAYDPARARFRTFLRSCVDHVAANARRAERRQKRGGGVPHLPLDFEGVERDLRLAVPGADPGECFEAEWRRAIFAAAVQRLRDRATTEGHALRFRVFERYDLLVAEAGARPTYAALARELDLPVTQVTNFLAWARREFRREILETLREASATEAEFRAEAHDLLGFDPA